MNHLLIIMFDSNSIDNNVKDIYFDFENVIDPQRKVKDVLKSKIHFLKFSNFLS